MSAPLAASTLLVPTFTFSFAARALARSSCATVAQVDFAESMPFFNRACRIMPPILPAPRNATFFPARSFPMISLGTHKVLNTEDTGYTEEPQIPEEFLNVPRVLSGLSFMLLALSLHPIPRGRHHFAQAARRFPLQQRLRLCRIRHQRSEDLPGAVAPSSAALAFPSLPQRRKSLPAPTLPCPCRR